MSDKVILLVEDNADDTELALNAFDRFKLANRIEVVRDGAAALDYLFATGDFAERDATQQPSLVLLDLKLLRVHGLEVLKRLRADPRTSLLPVVVLSSSKQQQDMLSSYQLGANSYIRKPVDFDQFVETVRELGLYWLVLNEPPPRPQLK